MEAVRVSIETVPLSASEYEPAHDYDRHTHEHSTYEDMAYNPEHGEAGHVCSAECLHTQEEANAFAESLLAESELPRHGEFGHVCDAHCLHTQEEADKFAQDLLDSPKTSLHDHEHGHPLHVCGAECLHTQNEADAFASVLLKETEQQPRHGEKGHVCDAECLHTQEEADTFAKNLLSETPEKTSIPETIKSFATEETPSEEANIESITETPRQHMETDTDIPETSAPIPATIKGKESATLPVDTATPSPAGETPFVETIRTIDNHIDQIDRPLIQKTIKSPDTDQPLEAAMNVDPVAFNEAKEIKKEMVASDIVANLPTADRETIPVPNDSEEIIYSDTNTVNDETFESFRLPTIRYDEEPVNEDESIPTIIEPSVGEQPIFEETGDSLIADERAVLPPDITTDTDMQIKQISVLSPEEVFDNTSFDTEPSLASVDTLQPQFTGADTKAIQFPEEATVITQNDNDAVTLPTIQNTPPEVPYRPFEFDQALADVIISSERTALYTAIDTLDEIERHIQENDEGSAEQRQSILHLMHELSGQLDIEIEALMQSLGFTDIDALSNEQAIETIKKLQKLLQERVRSESVTPAVRRDDSDERTKETLIRRFGRLAFMLFTNNQQATA